MDDLLIRQVDMVISVESIEVQRETSMITHVNHRMNGAILGTPRLTKCLLITKRDDANMFSSNVC